MQWGQNSIADMVFGLCPNWIVPIEYALDIVCHIIVP